MAYSKILIPISLSIRNCEFQSKWHVFLIVAGFYVTGRQLYDHPPLKSSPKAYLSSGNQYYVFRNFRSYGFDNLVLPRDVIGYLLIRDLKWCAILVISSRNQQ